MVHTKKVVHTRWKKVVRRGHRWSQTGTAVCDGHPDQSPNSAQFPFLTPSAVVEDATIESDRDDKQATKLSLQAIAQVDAESEFALEDYTGTGPIIRNFENKKL